jgi:hypothetical protein
MSSLVVIVNKIGLKAVSSVEVVNSVAFNNGITNFAKSHFLPAKA